MYVLDSRAQVDNRRRLPFGSQLKPDLLLALTEMLQRESPFVQLVKEAAAVTAPNYVLSIPSKTRHSQDRRTHNRPTVGELAVFLPETEAKARRIQFSVFIPLCLLCYVFAFKSCLFFPEFF